MPRRFTSDRLRKLLASVDALLATLTAGADARAAAIAAVPPDQTASARNLAHYLALRCHDLRQLQAELRDLSLSSLGRLEGNVYETVRGVRLALMALLGELPTDALLADAGQGLSSDEADRKLSAHAERLLGPRPPGHATRIMVTLPSEAAADAKLVAALVEAGMGVARINLAHDDAAAWTAMAAHVRAAEAQLGRPCRILADLPGPKLRTGELAPGPEVVRVRPRRDAFGMVVVPAHAVFVDPGAPAATDRDRTATELPLARAIGDRAAPGDQLTVRDTRGRLRRFVVQRAGHGRCDATCDRTAYLGTGCPVELLREGDVLATTQLGRVPPRPLSVPLQVDDTLLVTRDPSPGRPATARGDGSVEPARVPCSLPDVFDDVRAGDRILFDDGKIAGTVIGNDGDALTVHVTAVPPGGGKLRAEKGINLPDTELRTPALAADDAARLDWIAAHADMAGLSFVQRTADVARLHAELDRRHRGDLGIVLKIETAIGFERLPELLFAGLVSPPLGVMVARGDLAAELGYARLAEVQEEILWLCEAAHVPVIWATQVLDSMARTGQPSRAEVTDAAMGGRAECVMLNKGPFIVDTVRFLGGVLHRMQDHLVKKRAQLRRLRIAEGRGRS